MIPLKYQTSSQKFVLGQFMSTDGNTAATGLTINSSDVVLLKHNSTSVGYKSTTGLTHESSGFYGGSFSSDDADTLGGMRIFVHVSSALLLKEFARVMTANEYDSYILGTDYMQVDSVQISGVASTDQIATSSELSSEVWNYAIRTLSAGAISSATISSGALYSSAHILSSVAFSSGWFSSVSMSSGAISSLALTTEAWDNGSYSVWANSTKLLSSGATVWSATTRTLTDLSSVVLSTAGRDAVVDAVWDEDRADHVSTASMGYNQSTTQVFNLTGDITGNLSGSVGSVTDRSSFALSTAAIDANLTAYVESTETLKQTLMILRAESAGASTGGGGSTAVFYSPNSTALRIKATVSSDGNRNTPTFDLT